jgi:DNA polymerase (family 10)
MSPVKLSNQRLANTFYLIGNLLEIKGEVIYKILAYRKAGDNLMTLNREAYDLWQQGQLSEIPGVGKAIAEKIDELFTTGKLEFLEKLSVEVPPSLAELLQVPDLGPKKVGLFWKELGITDLTGLEAAARAGKLRDLPGMGEKSEAKILAGIESLSRRSARLPLGRAWPAAQRILSVLREAPGVTAADAAGSLRRMRETVGDLDLLVAARDSGPVMKAFVELPECIARWQR